MYLILLPIVGLSSKTCIKLPLKDIHNKGHSDKWALNAGRKYCRMLCNTFDLHYVIIGLEKTNTFLSFVERPLKTGFTVYN